MTKLDVNLSSKKSDTVADDAVKEPSETQNLQNNGNNEEPATINVCGPAIMIGEIEISTQNPNKMPINEPLVTFEWRIIKRVAISQLVLSAIAMTCVVSVILSMGMDCYKFSQFIMSMYLLFTAYSGIKGSNKSHMHLVVYFIMTALQWMINIVLLGCLTFTVYEAPYENYNFRYALRGIHTGDYGSDVVVLLTEVVASSTMIGTVVTGMLGLTACCKGFGRLLAYQEAFLQTRRESMEQA